MSDAISLAQVEAAQPMVYQHMRPTPLIHYPLLSQEMGFQAYVKHENHTPIGAFKIRGGLNLMAHLARQGVPGVITATRGNHGQSVALAARFYHIPATIVVPAGNNPEKNAMMRAQGAELIEHGRDFDEARALVKISAVFDEFSPLGPHHGILLGVIARWHDDGGRDMVKTRCECHGLAVITASRRNHPRYTLACQMRHEIEPATDFKGANGGVIFVFDVGLKPHFLGEQ